MPLHRITFAKSTLRDLFSLPYSEQSILLYLLERRNMRDRPLRPTNYISHEEIAEDTNFSIETIRTRIGYLKKDGWIKELTRQKNELTRYRYTLERIQMDIERTFEIEDEDETVESDDVNIYLHNNRYWRIGGALGYQYRRLHSRMWVDTGEVPNEVENYFS